MSENRDPASRNEAQQLLHELSNALNAVVTAGRCFQVRLEDDPQNESLTRAFEDGADEARTLIEQLHSLLR